MDWSCGFFLCGWPITCHPADGPSLWSLRKIHTKKNQKIKTDFTEFYSFFFVIISKYWFPFFFIVFYRTGSLTISLTSNIDCFFCWFFFWREKKNKRKTEKQTVPVGGTPRLCVPYFFFWNVPGRQMVLLRTCISPRVRVQWNIKGLFFFEEKRKTR